jgi:hypothetical protein
MKNAEGLSNISPGSNGEVGALFLQGGKIFVYNSSIIISKWTFDG